MSEMASTLGKAKQEVRIAFNSIVWKLVFSTQRIASCTQYQSWDCYFWNSINARTRFMKLLVRIVPRNWCDDLWLKLCQSRAIPVYFFEIGILHFLTWAEIIMVPLNNMSVPPPKSLVIKPTESILDVLNDDPRLHWRTIHRSCFYECSILLQAQIVGNVTPSKGIANKINWVFRKARMNVLNCFTKIRVALQTVRFGCGQRDLA